MIDNALKDICVLYGGGISRSGSNGSIRKEDVLLWSNESGLGIKETFDQVSVSLGHAFLDHSLDWEFCDVAANDLHHALNDFYITEVHHVEEPQLFWRFFLAFDHSETVETERADKVARTAVRELLSELPERA